MLTVAEQLDLIREATKCPVKAKFAKWIGARSAQAVDAWTKQGRRLSLDGAKMIHRATGASIDWLTEQKGPPFPNGPTIYSEGAEAVTQAAIRNLEEHADDVGVIVGLLVRAFTLSSPTGAPVLLAQLKAALPKDRSSPVLAAAFEAAAEAAKTQASVRPASAPLSRGGKS